MIDFFTYLIVTVLVVILVYALAMPMNDDYNVGVPFTIIFKKQLFSNLYKARTPNGDIVMMYKKPSFHFFSYKARLVPLLLPKERAEKMTSDITSYEKLQTYHMRMESAVEKINNNLRQKRKEFYDL